VAGREDGVAAVSAIVAGAGTGGALEWLHAIQVLRTYPARLRCYPLTPHGEPSIAHAYRKAFARVRCLVYVEDRYLWSSPTAGIIASALRDKPNLHWARTAAAAAAVAAFRVGAGG
jgi:hypothetical protein